MLMLPTYVTRLPNGYALLLQARPQLCPRDSQNTAVL